MSLPDWDDRPREEARLLNPAFIAALLWACADGHGAETGTGLPYPLSFIALPVVLHRPTRIILPSSKRTSLAAWLGAHPRALVGFSGRASTLVTIVKGGLLFGCREGLIAMNHERIHASPRPRTIASFERKTTDEVKDCLKRARFVGRWFAGAGQSGTVMALWGVSP
ncbi:three component ABC system middle component [Rhodovulum sulfidophilum]|uniref:three component ABC system middle component n=1 Tax=Rhodovulum sulfidophilum TaxID=35806 RepID=UPI003B20FEE7